MPKKNVRDPAQTKVVIRRLPPLLTEEEFFEQLKCEVAYDYSYFESSDSSLGLFAFCRVYMNMRNGEEVLKLRNAVDGCVFHDGKGHEYPAVVEFAPCQKVPKFRRRADPKMGTLEKDAEYQAFLQTLQAEPEKLTSPDLTAEQEEARQKEIDHQHKNTPLVEFLRQKHASRSSSSRSAAVGILQSGKGGRPSASDKSSKSSRAAGKEKKGESHRSSSKPSKRESRSKRLDDPSAESTKSSKSTSKSSKPPRSSAKDHRGDRYRDSDSRRGGHDDGWSEDTRDRRHASSRGHTKDKAHSESWSEAATSSGKASRHEKDRSGGRLSRESDAGWGDEAPSSKSSAKPERGDGRRQRRPAQQIYTPRSRSGRSGDSASKRDT